MPFAVLFGPRLSSFDDPVMPSDSLKLTTQKVKTCKKLILVSLTRNCRMASEQKRYMHMHMGAVHSIIR